MLLRILDRLEEIIIASLMAAATILIFVSVVHRFGTGVPFLYPYLIRIHISWAQELCIYMFIWMAKFGAAYGVRTGIHVGVDVLINRLNPRWQKGLILCGVFGGAFFTLVVGTMGAKFVIELMSTDQVSPDLELPSWIVYACIPLGSYLMSFRFLQVAWPTGRPVSCRIMMRPMSTASRSVRPRRSRSEKRDERRADFRAAVCPDADRHADLDFARPYRLDLPVHDDRGANRDRRSEVVLRPRQFRHHGYTVFHSCRHLPDPRRRRAPHDCLHHFGGRPFAGRAGPGRRRGLRDVRGDLGLQRRHGGGDRLDHDAGHG